MHTVVTAANTAPASWPAQWLPALIDWLPDPMLTATLLVIWKLILPLLFVVAVIDWLTASDDRRVRILRRTGLTQLQIATRLNITRHRVRRALAS